MSFIDDLRIKQDGAKTQNHTPTDAQKAAAKALSFTERYHYGGNFEEICGA